MSGVMAKARAPFFDDGFGWFGPIASTLGKGKGAPDFSGAPPPYAYLRNNSVAAAPAVVAVAVASAAVVERDLDLLFQPLDAVLDFARLARVEAVAGLVAQPAVDPVGLVE